MLAIIFWIYRELRLRHIFQITLDQTPLILIGMRSKLQLNFLLLVQVSPEQNFRFRQLLALDHW